MNLKIVIELMIDFFQMTIVFKVDYAVIKVLQSKSFVTSFITHFIIEFISYFIVVQMINQKVH